MTQRKEIKMFTVDQANAILPKVQASLAEMREIKKTIMANQARIDIEEMTAVGGNRPQDRIEPILKEIEHDVHSFHKAMESLGEMGCELKDLETGLVDFYSMRDKEVVFLCWQEGEDQIEWWHPLETGFGGRQPL